MIAVGAGPLPFTGKGSKAGVVASGDVEVYFVGN
jgi:hypothetical protein